MRQRSGASLVDDAYKKADLEAFTTRYPRPEVLRYVNQGGAELWDLIIDCLGKPFGRSSTPWTITTVEGQIEYTDDFPTDFLELLSVRLQCPFGQMLSRLATPEEAFLRDGVKIGYPDYYELIPGGMQLFPSHRGGLCVIVEYVRGYTDLADASDSYFDGIDGWEEYMVCHAAREMALKEGELEFAREMAGDKMALRERIKRRAPRRDAHRPRRARDIRGERMGRWRP